MITHTAGLLSIGWDRDLVDDLTRVGAEQDATLYMVLLAAYQATLARHSGQVDFAIGSPSAGRVRPELDGVVGPFVNMLPMRARLAGDPTFRQIVDRVKETSLLAFEHQEFPLVEMIVDQDLKRDTSRAAIFQTTFALQNYDVRRNPTAEPRERPSVPRVENFRTRTRASASTCPSSPRRTTTGSPASSCTATTCGTTPRSWASPAISSCWPERWQPTRRSRCPCFHRTARPPVDRPERPRDWWVPPSPRVRVQRNVLDRPPMDRP